MKTYSDHGCHERIMFFSVYHKSVQTIIIQDTVVDTFRCGMLVVYFFISFSTSRDVCVQPDVPLRPGFDNPSIFGRGAAGFAFGFVVFSIRTAPHLVSNVPFGTKIISVRDHRKPGSTDRSAIFINTDVIMDRFGMPIFRVEINQGTYIPFFEELVSGEVVHSGIKAHILYRKGRHMFFQLVVGNKEGNGIMAFRTGEA